jgi:hypothetical protein
LHDEQPIWQTRKGVLAKNKCKYEALDQAPAKGHKPGDLGYTTPTSFTLILLEIFKTWNSSRQQLDNDRSINKWKNAQTKDPNCRNTTACEDVKKTNKLATTCQKLLKSDPINPRHGNVDTQSNQKQKTKGKQNSVPQTFGLNQLGENFSCAWIATPTENHGGEGMEEQI